jgi:SAM-dependent methyltransferase
LPNDYVCIWRNRDGPEYTGGVMGDVYSDGRYAASNPGYHVEDSAWKAQQVLALLDRHALRPQTVAEIGCGAGEIVRQLCDAMPGASRFEGWEISPQAIALCRQREGGRLAFRTGDLLAAEVPAFDLVLCLDVFEHVEDYYGFLRRLHAKGRHFVFHVPLDLSVQSVLRGSPIHKARVATGHVHYFTKDTALASLESAGYRVLGWQYTAGSLDRPDRSFLQRIARGPRRLGLKLAPDLTVRILGGCSLLVLAR